LLNDADAVTLSCGAGVNSGTSGVVAHEIEIDVMQHGAWERVPIDAQSVEAPLSRSAVFLVMAAAAVTRL
jgi:hypothetical protein